MEQIVDLRNSSKHYTVYLITNQITGERYIGQHQTYDLDDGYMGSGRLLKRKFEEYGIEHFNKEILVDFDNFEEMNTAEIKYIKELNPEYNISLGGESFEGVNSVPGLNNKAGQYKKAHDKHLWLMKNDKEYSMKVRKALSESMKKSFEEGRHRRAFGHKYWLGKKHTEESKKKMSESKRGKQTISTLGKHWYTNGKENICCFEQNKPRGYRKGRTLKSYAGVA